MVACDSEVTARPGADVSIVPCGTDFSFCINSQHFVLGYFDRVPTGRTCLLLQFSIRQLPDTRLFSLSPSGTTPHRTILSPYIYAYGRPPD